VQIIKHGGTNCGMVASSSALLAAAAVLLMHCLFTVIYAALSSVAAGVVCSQSAHKS
jgi:hypothetical protein